MWTQRDPKTGELEGLSFDFNLCEAVATWEQVSLLFSLPKFVILLTSVQPFAPIFERDNTCLL